MIPKSKKLSDNMFVKFDGILNQNYSRHETRLSILVGVLKKHINYEINYPSLYFIASFQQEIFANKKEKFLIKIGNCGKTTIQVHVQLAKKNV